MPSRHRAQEFFELDADHHRQDAGLHAPILDEGDHDAARAVSRSVMKRLGLSAKQIEALQGQPADAPAEVRGLPRDWTIERGSLHKTREFDPDQPRDELGRWTDEGGGSGGSGSDSSASYGSSAPAAPGGSHQGVHARPSRPYEGGSGSGAGGGGLLNGAVVKQSFTPSAGQKEYAESHGATPLTFHELGHGGAEAFHQAIADAKAASPHGAAVTLYSTDDYKGMRTFLTKDGKAGFALKGDDIVSVFKNPGSDAKQAVSSVLALAVQQGGRRLDCFDTQLPYIYAAEGFRATGRIPFDDNYKPDGWKEEDFKRYNGGKPDVVFMVRDIKAPAYTPGDGKKFASYDEAAAHQIKAVGDHYHATELFDQHRDPGATVEQITAKVPTAGIAIGIAESKLKDAVSTHAQVSEGGFLQPDGRYTPERQALHAQILNELFSPEAVKAAAPANGEKPTMTLLGGRGGSGKSWFTKTGVADAAHAVYINPDDIQAKLPGYEGWNAAHYHDEASDITKLADTYARALGVSVIHDATMRTPGGSAKRVADYKAAGYNVHGHYMFLPPQMSTKRALERFVRGGKDGRYVRPSYTLGSVTNEQTFDTLKGDMDKWSIYENMGKSPQLVAEGGK